VLAPSAIRILPVSEEGVLYFAACASACCQRFGFSVWAVCSQCQAKCLREERVPHQRKDGQVHNRKLGSSVKMLLFLPFCLCKLEQCKFSSQWLTLLGQYKHLDFLQSNSHTFLSAVLHSALCGVPSPSFQLSLLHSWGLVQGFGGGGGFLCFNIARKHVGGRPYINQVRSYGLVWLRNWLDTPSRSNASLQAGCVGSRTS